MLTCLGGYAQEDAYLRTLTERLMKIRKAKVSNEVLNQTVLDWSASGCPKITLMDNIRRDAANEFRGSNANRFKANQVITHVYNRQNTGMVAKGDFFNSTEKDVFYSGIEKTVKKGCTVTYTLTGHIGVQEFVFLSYNPKTQFKATVNGKEAPQTAEGVRSLKIERVEKDQKITFTITNQSGSNESFVILNHNPQS